MNLHGIASAMIGAVNPPICITIKSSIGSVTGPDSSRTPQYNEIPNVTAQDQPMSTTDLRRVDGLNLTGHTRSVYINGAWDGAVNRPKLKGGDLIIKPDGSTWLVNIVAEAWPEWTHVICTLQLDKRK